MIIPVDHKKLYDDASEFFNPAGNVIMQLSSNAAIDVCLQAAERGLVVLGVEGGVSKSEGFEPRGDCIWDGSSTVRDMHSVIINNKNAAEFIKCKRNVHNAFFVTVVWINRKDKIA